MPSLGELAGRISLQTAEFKRAVADVKRQTASIKDAEIGVRADTTKAKAELKGLDGVIGDFARKRARIVAEADTAEARLKLADLDGRIQRLSQRRAEVEVAITADASGLHGEVSRASRAAAIGNDVKVGLDLKKADAALAGIHGFLTGTIPKFVALQAVMEGLKFPALVAGVGQAAGAIGGLTGATVAVTAALSRLAGAAPVAGVAVAGLGQTFGTVALATAGLKDAFKEHEKSGDAVTEAQQRLTQAMREHPGPARAVQSAQKSLTDATAKHGPASEQATKAQARLDEVTKRYGSTSEQVKSAQKALTEAQKEHGAVLEGFHPAAQRFFTTVLSFKPAFEDLKRTAQGGLFPGVTEGLIAVRPLFATLSPVIAGTGSALGELARQFGAMFGSPAWQTAITVVGQANIQALQLLSPALLAVADAVRSILVVASPFLVVLAQMGALWLQGLAAQWQTAAATGSLTALMRDMTSVVSTLGAIFGNVFGIVGSVFRAAQPLGMDLLQTFANLTGRAREFLASFEGQARLTEFFEGIRPLLTEVGRLLGDVGRGLAGLAVSPGLAALVAQIRTELLPALLEMVHAMTGDFSSGFVTALTNITRIITLVMENFAFALPIINALAPAFLAILPPIGQLAQLLSGFLVGAIQTLLPPLITLGTTVLGALVPAFESFLVALQPVLPILGAALMQVALALIPVIQQMAPTIGHLAVAFAQVLVALTPILPSLARLLIAILPLLPTIMELAFVSLRLTAAMAPIITLFAQIVAAAIGLVATILGPLVTGIRIGVQQIIGAFLLMASTVLGLAERAFGWVPGLGPKLGEARAAVDQFRDQVNAALGGIHDKDVKIRISPYASNEEVAKSTGTAVRTRYATGGRVFGSGNKDTVPALLTPGEFVMRKAAVRKLGPDWLEFLNKTGKMPPHHEYAAGGPVINFASNMGEVEKAIRHAALTMAPPLGMAGAPGAYQAMFAAARSVFPWLRLISGFRPGAITATGNRSYHAQGRAVDINPDMRVFDWIRANYGGRTKELIFSPAGGRQIHNGRPHVYSGITRAMHWDHVHWAMRHGGLVDKMHTGGGVGFRPGREVAAFLERGEGVMSLSAMARLDDALRSVSPPTSSTTATAGGTSVVVHVHPSPGMDEAALARKVGDTLGRRADLLSRGG
ncbi:MAG: hypothetical protein M3404_02510 [Actinomycetota bacterium]|nr:hypothetical protein [Actinomycetota bacterium]